MERPQDKLAPVTIDLNGTSSTIRHFYLWNKNRSFPGFYSVSWSGSWWIESVPREKKKKIIIFKDVVSETLLIQHDGNVHGYHKKTQRMISHYPTASWRFYWAVLIIAYPISAVPIPSFIDSSWLYIRVVVFVIKTKLTLVTAAMEIQKSHILL